MINTERLYADIGESIFKFRELQTPKLSQQDLAKALGLTRTSITNIEAGQQKITLHSLYALCERFGLEITDVLPSVSSVSTQDPRSIVVAGRSHDVGAKTASVVDRLRPANRPKK